MLVVQSLHVAPLPPQAAWLVPAWQVPPAQQPFVHAFEALQARMQMVPVQDIEPDGQSDSMLHPQAPPPVVGSHTIPKALVAQALQRPPLLPH